MSFASPSAVQRRHVFFVAGFDRKRPRYYHALYRSQAHRQAAVSGLDIQVSRERSQPSANSSAWTTTAQSADGSHVHSSYELLEWHDIVQAHWARSAWKVLVDGIATLAFGLRDGAVQRMFRLFAPPVYATVLPLLMVTLCAVLGVGSGVALAWLTGSMTGAATLLSMAIGAAAAAAVFGTGVKLVHRFQMTWLLRLARFAHLQAAGAIPELDHRLSAFAQRIAAIASRDDTDAPDEILIVGHSVGANLAVSLLARVLELQEDRNTSRRAPLVLLSLGHCLPLLSSLSQAENFRRDLHRVAQSNIDWLDITAPIDWAAFPQVDPVAAAGLPPAAAPGWHPRLLSPRFHLLFSKVRYQQLKRNRFQVHMQYLMASELAGRYDYFSITAGPQTLRERYSQTTEEQAASSPIAGPEPRPRRQSTEARE